MTFKEIETLVTRGENVPPSAMMHERSCWHALRSLYADFRRGVVDTDTATKEKRRVHGTFDWACTQAQTQEKLRNGWIEQLRVSEEFRTKLHKGVKSGEDLHTLFYLACTCIAVMTGDQTLAGSVVKRRRDAVHQMALTDMERERPNG